MIVIAEGIDRVGKTTLCNMLHEQFGFAILRDDCRYFGGYIDKNINTEKVNTIMNLLEDGLLDNVVIDRFHLTELVYGELDRGYANEEMFDIDKRLAKLKNVAFVLVVSEDVVQSSKQHGADLSCHDKMMKQAFFESKVADKIALSYSVLAEAVEFIKARMSEN